MNAVTDASGATTAPIDFSRPFSTAEYLRYSRQLSHPSSAMLRVAVLGTCNLDFCRPYLIVEGARIGLAIRPEFGAFGQVEQVIADPGSSLYASPLDGLLVVMRPEDVSPDAMARPFAAGRPGLASLLTELRQRIVRSVTQFREHSSAPILVANFADPTLLPFGPFDANVPFSVTHALAEANAALVGDLAAFPNVAIFDLAGLVRRVGTANWSDPRLWALARVPVAAAHQPALAAQVVRSLRALRVPPAKCLVLDLDNTLWGGVIGDDGMTGIQLGEDYPGNVFKEFQRRILALLDRGILLAVVSKNDAPVAEEVFLRHPDMLIKWSDIAASRIDWSPKSQHLRAIARELNIGADALVFFDDNPVERAEVRLNAPEVQVVEVPTDPLQYASALDRIPWFDQTSLSDEDRKRTALYRDQKARTEGAEQFGNIDDFLASLEMTAEVGRWSDTTAARIAQLIGKTNQFNLTTRRHTAADLERIAADPRSCIAWIRVADRFGDQGLVGVGIIRAEGESARLDSLLMSCRVMNRRVEHALFAYLAEQARRLGCRHIAGEYLPTAKNGMVAQLLPSLGFSPTADEPVQYALRLDERTLPWPDVLRRVDADTGTS
ncbi:MAG: HAD family hydrolase [Gemmatimonadetes bacterium]|nr:HAD family hydrolase [Gemmatimonadota bacterium]